MPPKRWAPKRIIRCRSGCIPEHEMSKMSAPRSRILFVLAAVLFATAFLGANQSGVDATKLVRDTLPEDFGAHIPYGLAAKIDPPAQAKLALGRALFFDAALSDDGSLACASCHLPDHGFADVKPLSAGVHGHSTKRNAPSLVNRALGQSFFWDGRWTDGDR